MVAKRVCLASRGCCRTANVVSVIQGRRGPGAKRRAKDAKAMRASLEKSSTAVAASRSGGMAGHNVAELLYQHDCFRIPEGVTRMKGRRGESNAGLRLNGNLGGHKPMILLALKCECNPRNDCVPLDKVVPCRRDQNEVNLMLLACCWMSTSIAEVAQKSPGPSCPNRA